VSYPEITCARIIVRDHEIKTDNFRETPWKQAVDIHVLGDRVGTVEVLYLEERPETQEGPLVEEEETLLSTVAERLGQIVERLEIQEALLIRDKAIASSFNGIGIIDLTGNFIYANDSLLKMWGYEENEVVGKSAARLWFREKEAKKMMEVLVDEGNWVGELAAKRRDGSFFDVQIFASLVIDERDDPLCLVGSFMDITEEKILQDQLIRSERLVASGQIAASIAHEINSPLQGIISVINTIERKYGRDEWLIENVGLVKDGFVSIRDTVNKLLDLNRPGKEVTQYMNVNSVIEDTVSLLKNHLGKNKVEVTLSLSPEVPDMTASPQQLGQVFLNLINNLLEAMVRDVESGDSPKVREKTGGEISIYSSVSKETIVVRVTDTGPGISREDLKHVFDPFYSRKKKMGMGIGLSICHSIIEDHGGSIMAETSPKGGVVFTISLPVKRTKK